MCSYGTGFLALAKWTSVYLLRKFASVIFTPFCDFTEHFAVIIRNRAHVRNNKKCNQSQAYIIFARSDVKVKTRPGVKAKCTPDPENKAVKLGGLATKNLYSDAMIY